MTKAQTCSTRQAADILGCTMANVSQLIKTGKLKAVRWGKRSWAVYTSSVTQYARKPRVGRPRIGDKAPKRKSV